MSHPSTSSTFGQSELDPESTCSQAGSPAVGHQRRKEAAYDRQRGATCPYVGGPTGAMGLIPDAWTLGASPSFPAPCPSRSAAA